MGNADLVRASRDGDQFHYLWAARKALLLLNPLSGLHTLTIEGPSKCEFIEAVEEGEEIVDVGEYYGSNSFIDASKIIYSQLKHSTVQINENFPPSSLKNTIEGFSKRFRKLLTIASKDIVLQKVEFHFVSNRAISTDFYESIKQLQETGQVNKIENLRKLENYTELNGQDLEEFVKLIKFPSQEPNYIAQREILAQEVSGYLSGDDINAPNELKELITRKALSENQETPEITRYDVLRALKTNPDDLFPVKNLIKQLERIVDRPIVKTLVDTITESRSQKFIIQAEGGVGKSILSTQIHNYIPSGSLSIIYDCFGNGDYRQSSSARHSHKVALVQIANELAGLGLCHPLIPTTNAGPSEYIKAFLFRLKQVSERISLDKAQLFIVIDAADNSQMAADEFNYGRSFITDLLQEILPKNIKIIALSRPYRVNLLMPKQDVEILDLIGFTEDETKQHLINYYTEVSTQDAIEFHRLTSGNPRVQSIALEQNLTLNEILSFFGGTPKSVEDTIKDLLDKAISTFKEQNYSESEEVDLLLTSIAILRPLIPLQILSDLTNIRADQIRSIISDIGGHPIRLSDNNIQFVDEPTESWFREIYKPKDISILNEFIQKLKPLSVNSVYAASVLPQILMDAGKFEELVELSLNSEMLPTNSTLEKRKVELQRLQFAIKAGLKLGKYTDVAKLSLKAGGEVAAETRQHQLLEENIDLVGTTFSDNQILELISEKVFKGGSWHGSKYITEAKLLSYREEFHGESRSKLRIANEWLTSWFNLPEDQKHNQEIESKEISDYFITLITLEGVDYAINWLRRWHPKSVSYDVAKLITKDLIKLNKKDVIQQILDTSGNNIFLTLGTVEILNFNHSDINSKNFLRILNLLSYHKVKLDIGLSPILCFLEVVFKKALCSSTEAYQILSKYLPAQIPYEITDRFGNSDRATYMKAYALHKAWNNKSLELIDLVTERLKEEFLKDTSYSSSEEITTLKRDVAAVLPWYKLYAHSIIEPMLPEKIDSLIEQAKLDSNKAQGYSYREYGNHLENEIAKIWFDILILNNHLSQETYPQIENNFKEKIYPQTRNHFTFILALQKQYGLENYCYQNIEKNLETLETSDDHAEILVSDYMSIAQSIFPLDQEEASAILSKAIEVSSKLGEENLQRWNALLCYGVRAGQEQNNRKPQLCYRFSQCAELTYKYVHRDKHFPWDYTVDAIYDLDPNSAFAIASRWRDRRFGDEDRILGNLVDKLLKEQLISPLIPLAFKAMGGIYDLDNLLNSIKSLNLEDELKRKILQSFYLYIVVPNPSEKHISGLRDLVEAFHITEQTVQDFFISLSNSEFYVQVEEPHSSTYDQEKFDWDVFFESYTDSNRSVDFNSAFNDFQKLENKHWIKRAFYVQLFQKINPSQAISLINWWFDNPRNGMYDLDDLLKAIPSRFKRRMSFLAVLDSSIKQFLKTHHSDFYIDTYGSNLKLHILSELTGKPKTDYIRSLLEGMSESSITLESESLFRIAHLLTPMIAPNQSCEVLEYGLGLLESDLGSDIADGQWREELAPPGNIIKSISGYIWSGLASPFNTVKWQAAHTVKLLCDFEQRELLSNLINFISDKNYRSFYDHKFEFYQYSATQWLLNALLKVSYSPNNFLAEYVEIFKQLVDPNRPHLMIRLLASKILLNLFSLKLITLNEEEIKAYQGVGKSTFSKVKRETVDLSNYSNINQENVDSFGIDFGPYWLNPLGEMFGLHPSHIYFETTQTLMNDIGFAEKNRRLNDMRQKMEIYNWKQTNHDHGSSPKVEDLDFYLSYHAMMIIADKLLQTRPLLISEDCWRDFDEWIKRHDLSCLEPYWLSDFRDPCPRITTEWPQRDTKNSLNWSYSCSLVDYQDAIHLSDIELCLWGGWSEVNNFDQAKDIRIRSSLVSPETSSALWRSLQSAESSHSYHLPSAGDEQFELDEDNFQLKGWISDIEIDLSNFDDDLWGASLRHKGIKPSKEIISLMNLHSDSLSKNWFCENEKVINLTIWGEYKNENYEYSNGYKLKVNKKFIFDLLNKINMDMVISVDIDRRYKYGSYQSKQDSKGLDEYLPSSKRVYLMKKNGDMYVY
ncbi:MULTISPECIES: hypothetical protein [Acinetobacter]|uniref:Nephrocystin 3-like N-terminal domain-containing protein n=1 Tax=Acinetobacter pittii TaxID=48296 RepID=A0A242U1J9_ACIPI|nr:MULTISPECIES: hypothetical protein [Acinetobacter]MBJ8499681.1 hypothetical protein [Acinetobacter pittii]MBJ9893696.1 hypothetical protein [Acinetobacter pittii]MCU4476965.1 hypothetical protein [Acinetobacter sp. WU_MDCI_Abxd143]OTU25968.1 hypothetical protein CAT59_17315 [Acinetobacter pittii]